MNEINEILAPCVPHLPPTYAQSLFWMGVFVFWGYVWGTLISCILTLIGLSVPRRALNIVGALVMLGIVGAMIPRAAETWVIYGEPLRELNWPYLWGLVYAAGLAVALSHPGGAALAGFARALFIRFREAALARGGKARPHDLD